MSSEEIPRMSHGGVCEPKSPNTPTSAISSDQRICKQNLYAPARDNFCVVATAGVHALLSTLLTEHESSVRALQSEISLLQQQLGKTENREDPVVDESGAANGCAAHAMSEGNNVADSSTGCSRSGLPASGSIVSHHSHQAGQTVSEARLHYADATHSSHSSGLERFKESMKPINKNAWKYASMGAKQRAWLLSFRGVRKFVLSTHFEMLTGFVIVANTVMMALEQQYKGFDYGHEIRPSRFTQTGSQAWPGAEIAFEVADIVFNCLFLMELMLRLYTFRCQSFKMPWMWFDGTIVALGVLDTLADDGGIGIDPTMARLVRLVRLVRLLKIFQSMSSFDSLFLLIKAISASLHALVWSFLLLLVVQVSSALFLNQMLRDSLNDNTKDLEIRDRLFEYFGTFSRSMVTMFEITLSNWVPSCRFLFENVSESFFWFFLVYRCMFCFCALKVIAAVFITETNKVMANDAELTVLKTQREKASFTAQLLKVLREIDCDGNGSVTKAELSKFMADSDMSLLLSTIGLEKSDVENIFHFIQEDGRCDAEKLVMKVVALRGQSNKIDFENLLAAVRLTEERVIAAVLNQQITLWHDMKRTIVDQQDTLNPTCKPVHVVESQAPFCEAAQSVEQSTTSGGFGSAVGSVMCQL